MRASDCNTSVSQVDSVVVPSGDLQPMTFTAWAATCTLAASSLLGDHAWVRTREQAIDEGWYGPKVTDAAAGRLGDVLLAARGTVAFYDPNDTGPYVLIGRHGSLTPDEMLVPFLAGVAGG